MRKSVRLKTFNDEGNQMGYVEGVPQEWDKSRTFSLGDKQGGEQTFHLVIILLDGTYDTYQVYVSAQDNPLAK
ncbi:hypothetical protein H6784_05535 [Candidatus Nomurabacteria bacterium]|nr:hypothetical protein [Candidatus Nomurabacteria bacterium]